PVAEALALLDPLLDVRAARPAVRLRDGQVELRGGELTDQLGVRRVPVAVLVRLVPRSHAERLGDRAADAGIRAVEGLPADRHGEELLGDVRMRPPEAGRPREAAGCLVAAAARAAERVGHALVTRLRDLVDRAGAERRLLAGHAELDEHALPRSEAPLGD